MIPDVRRMPRLVFLVAAAGTILAACGSNQDEGREERRAVRVPDSMFGVNGQVLRAMSAAGQVEQLDRQLASVERLGLKFVRAPADWAQLEPEAPSDGQRSYDFAGLDQWVGALARHQLRWYAIGLGASIPPWAASAAGRAHGCGGRSAPAAPADLAAMMRAIAERYGSAGEYWRQHPRLPKLPVMEYEVWNEENHGGFWCPAPDPEAYGRFYMAAEASVHAVEPRAEVIIGGLAPFSETAPAAPGTAAKASAADFLRDLVASHPALPERVDAVGIHTYGEPATILAQLRAARATLDELGMARTPLSLNEVGWPTRGENTAPVPEAARAEYIGRVTELVARSDCQVTTFAPHTWITEEANPSDPEHWFGIADPLTARPHPTANAYGSAARAAEREHRFPPSEVLALCGAGPGLP